MKLESLVIVGQHTTVNTFSSLVHTARQVSRVGGARIPQSRETAKSVRSTKSSMPDDPDGIATRSGNITNKSNCIGEALILDGR